MAAAAQLDASTKEATEDAELGTGLTGLSFQDSDEDEWDSTMYNTGEMTSWAAFLVLKGCAFDNISLWKSMGVALCVALATGMFAFMLPGFILAVLDPDQVARFGNFLTGFAGMLLGFFISLSMNRWYSCVEQFLGLLEAVRNLQMQMAALGVQKDRQRMVTRLGLLSVWLLHLSLNLDSDDFPELAVSGEKTEKQLDELKKQKLWKQLAEFRPDLVKADEKELLYPYKGCAGLVWTMIASYLGRMSQDGEVPALATPTFLRCLGIVEAAYNSIREVRQLHSVRPPFIYIHTLAVLVHMNNMIVSFSVGLSFGSSLNSIMSANEGTGSMVGTMIDWLCHYAYSVLPSLLYIAILEVSACVAQPFDHHDARFPARKFIKNMERDLKNAAIIADNPPWWEKPRFATKK